ncbi:MAG TPA: hypothetical protein VI978_01965 [Candidatus Paceibacterota bacterium]
MGGGGSLYNRDVSDNRYRTSAGYTNFAAQTISRNSVAKELLPFNRKLISSCKSPLVYNFDNTGSMDALPLIIVDKWPMVAGQIAMNKYLNDAMVSLGVTGDVVGDSAPLQFCDFAQIKDLDPWLSKLFIEKGGGGQHFESYEFTAYYYAYLYEMQNAETPIFLFTGDESFREELSGSELVRRFGGQHSDISAETVFGDLKKKFKGNVFLVHRFYPGYNLDPEIVSQWERVLGKESVVKIKSDLAIADITLGLIAIAGGARTLEGYIEDMNNRPLEMGGKKYEPQSPERIAEVRESLKLFAESREKLGQPENKKTSAKQNAKKKSKKKEDEDWTL